MASHPFRLLASIAALAAAAIAAAAQTPHDHHGVRHLHEHPEAYIKALEDPARDAYQRPQEVIAALEIKRGEIIADIGAGPGYFTLRLAKHVGQSGRVYAVDVSPDMVRHLNARIRDAGLTNVSTILAPPEDPLLPQPVDRVLFVNVWHHVEDQTGYLDRLKKSLKKGGEIVMIDFHKRELPVGPPVEMKISRDDLLAQMQANGFRLKREHTFLPYQYFMVFELGGS